MRQLIPLALSANTVAVMWLAGSKRWPAWVLGLVGQAGWLLFVVVFSAWGLLPLVVTLTVVYGRNLHRWRLSEPDASRHRPRRASGRPVRSVGSDPGIWVGEEPDDG